MFVEHLARIQHDGGLSSKRKTEKSERVLLFEIERLILRDGADTLL